MKNVKRPNKVRIGPWTYKIEYVTETQWLLEGEQQNWAGVSKHEEGVIRIRVTDGRSEDSMRETLLHELTHVVWTVSALNHFIDRENLEEHVISAQTPTLLALLSDNPNVVAYLINLGGPV